MSEKNQLQEYCQKSRKSMPTYIINDRGPSHQKEFKCKVLVDNQEFEPEQWFPTKKEAEKQAALLALKRLNLKQDSTTTSVASIAPSGPVTKVSLISLDDIAGEPDQNHLMLLNQVHQKKKIPTDKLPDWSGICSQGPSHQPIFGGKLILPGFDKEFMADFKFKTKKDAQQFLALEALKHIYKLDNTQVGSQLKSRETPVNKFDPNAEVPQTHSRPRSYQIELFKEAMKGNRICCLPTGAGKTLIGCLVIAAMKQRNPNKKILFLVDRIPLVFQQADAIEFQTGLVCLRCCGDNFSPAHLARTYDVMVCIASLFINIVQKKLLHIQDFSLIVIDEAHHTTKDHPFAIILRELYLEVEDIYRPKVLGLTASPAGEADFFSTLLKLKMLTKTVRGDAIMPKEKKSILELEDIVTPHSLTIHELPLDQREQEILKFRDLCMSEGNLARSSDKQITEMSLKDFEDDVAPPAEEIIDGEEIVLHPPQKLTIEQFCSKVMKYCNELLDFGQVTDMNLQPIPWIDDITQSLGRVEGLLSGSQLKLQRYWKTASEKLYAWSQSNDPISNDPKSEFDSKLGKLKQILNEYNEDSQFRGIIFVQTRGSAKKLCKYLELYSKENPRIHPEVITGHNSKGEGGMSINSQKQAIEKFREGKANILIGTSVIEEGFNVPDCNLVIRMDAPSTVTALVQSRGRLRQKESNFVALVKSAEGKTYEKLQKQEEALKAAVHFLQHNEPPEEYKNELNRQINDPTKTPLQIVEEMSQKAASAGFFQMQLKWFEKGQYGMAHCPTFVYEVKIGTNTYKDEGPSKQAARDRLAKQLLRDFILYKIISTT